MTEDDIQMYVAKMAYRAGLLFHADGNGNYLHAKTAGRKRLLGSRKGWPDLMFVLDSGITFIELKTMTGRVSPAQKLVHDEMKRLGCNVHVVYAKDGPDAWDQIGGILYAGYSHD